MCAARDQKEVSPVRDAACGGLPARCLWFHETGPLVPLATGMETRPESQQACQLGVVQTSAGNQGPPRCRGLLTPGFTLRKAILSCDHWSVTSTKHALGLPGFLGVIMDEEGRGTGRVSSLCRAQRLGNLAQFRSYRGSLWGKHWQGAM